MNNLTIAIQGSAGSGKTTMMLLIKKLLAKEGFDVNFDELVEFVKDDNDFDLRLKSIIEHTKIEVKEESIGRSEAFLMREKYARLVG